MLTLLLLALSLAVFAISYITVRDFFSPLKFYFMYLFFFYFDIFLNVQHNAVYFSYTAYLILGILMLPFEHVHYKNLMRVIKNRLRIFSTNIHKYLTIVLFLSAIPLIAQLLFIQSMGGLEAYLFSMVERVLVWQGMGHYIFFINFMKPINILFFLILLFFRGSYKKIWILIFVVHFIITVLMGLISGSRSSILLLLLVYFISYNYFVARIKLFTVFILVITFAFLLAFLQIFRTKNFITNDGFESIISGKVDMIKEVKNSPDFRSGIIPIEQLYFATFTNLQYGQTYITSITNFIPRYIWKAKPESGGTTLTKFIQKREWGGTTAFSTGLIGEGIINFGYYFGYFVAFIIGCLIFNLCFHYFIITKKVITQVINEKEVPTRKFFLYIYMLLYALQLPGMLSAGEFTNMMYNFFLNYLIAFIITKSIFSRNKDLLIIS